VGRASASSGLRARPRSAGVARVSAAGAEQRLALRPVVGLLPKLEHLRGLVDEGLHPRGVVAGAGGQLETVPGRVEEIDRQDEVVVVRGPDDLDALALELLPGAQQGLDVLDLEGEVLDPAGRLAILDVARIVRALE